MRCFVKYGFARFALQSASQAGNWEMSVNGEQVGVSWDAGNKRHSQPSTLSSTRFLFPGPHSMCLRFLETWIVPVVPTLIFFFGCIAMHSDIPTFAQQPPEIPAVSLTRGYFHRDGVSYFVFHAPTYGVRPDRVVVTGPFRSWSQDMEVSEWSLAPMASNADIWLLVVPNPGYSNLAPSSHFKYRIDDGRWMDPPAQADNRDSGNLVFEPGVVPIRLRAEIVGPQSISVRLSGNGSTPPLEPNAYRLRDAAGNSIAVSQILPNTSTEAFLFPKDPIDIRRVYYLEIPGLHVRSLCRRDGWLRHLYSDKVLGAEVSDDGTQTSFRLFAPRAEKVVLYLYKNPDDAAALATKAISLTKDPNGVWETIEVGDLHGTYYDFTVHGPSDPGNSFYETHPVHISDPYARVSVDSFGKGRVWRKTKPARPLVGGPPAMQDVIAYEVHIQDFTTTLPVSEDIRVTIPAMIVPGLKNRRGESIGFDYLVKLGVNVIHLMPVQDFLHYPDDEWQAAFKNDPFMIANGIHLENYDWGYRTTHAFAIESRFRKRGTEQGAQRDQFRDLVQAFHDHGIAVIVDIVPNHTGENMDGRHYLMNFNAIDLPYYYRTNDEVKHIGPYGNEVKTEDRPMVQRWLIDQCQHLIHEFGIDGFRIDLAGQIDKQTLIKLRQSLGQEIIIYGEPWIAPTDPEVANHPDWGWYKKDAPITYFQDDARNAFKGPTSNPRNKATDRGYAGGDASQRERTTRALMNSFDDERNPNMGINYLDIHDNWALADQFALHDWDGRLGVDQGPFRIAAGLLFTSLGPIVIHGGTEIMRSKGAAKLEERTMISASGKLAFHGKSDTYNMLTPNLFVWENVGEKPDAANGHNDYASMHRYWQGLIAFRRSDIGQVFRVGETPTKDYYRWILPSNEHLLGYFVDDRVLVLINTSQSDQHFSSVALPTGRWKLIADGDRIDPVHGVPAPDSQWEGPQTRDIQIAKTSLRIWIRE